MLHALIRRISLGLLALAIILPTTTLAATPAVALPFSEGNGSSAASTGSLGGAATLRNGATWTGGTSGSAIAFDGQNDVLTMPAVSGLADRGPLTVTAWIKPTTLGENNNAWIAGKAYSGGNLPGRGWRFGLTNSPARSLVFAVDYADSHLEVRGSSGAITLGAWNHVAVIWDGSQSGTGVRLFVNGTELTYTERTSGAGSRESDARYDLRVGSNPTGSRTFAGTIDDVQVYTSALSTSDVSTLAKAGSIATTTPPTTTPTPTNPTPTPTTTAPTPTPTTPTTTTPTTPPPTSSTGRYIPAQFTPWQWQLTGTVDQTVDAVMFDIDLFDVPTSTIMSLKQKGKKVICYFSAGSYEDWRPDAKLFPASVLGKSNGWVGEKWLDIRNLTALGPIMEKRMDMAKAKGCDGLEPDNVDGYTNDTGFPLTGAHQITFNKYLAAEAHERGLSIGLKNDVDQIAQLEPFFDFAVNEQCFQYNECETHLPFLSAGKAVFNVEYSLATTQFCTKANNLKIMSMKKNLDLDASRTVCWKTTGFSSTDPKPLTSATSRTVTATGWLNVRAAVGTSAEKLGMVAPGTTGTIIGSSADSTGTLWHQVSFTGGLSGWSSAEWLK